MTPLILKALRSLYKIDILYIHDKRLLNPPHSSMINREKMQKKCNIKAYCRYYGSSSFISVYDKGVASSTYTAIIIDYLNRIEGIRAYSIASADVIIEEQS